MLPDEGARRILRAERFALAEGQAERGGVRPERIVGDDCLREHVGPGRLDANVDMIAVIAPRPAVEAAILYRGHVIRDQVVADLIALIDRNPELLAPWVPGDAG